MVQIRDNNGAEHCRNKMGKEKLSVLMLAYYFPPVGGGGTIRIHNFVKYLPEFGIRPNVLTIKEEFSEQLSPAAELLDEYSPLVRIERTPVLGPAARDIKITISGGKKRPSVKDKLFAFITHSLSSLLLVPDSCILWYPYAIKRGKQLIKERNIKLIFTTGPPFSALLIGHRLAQSTGLPLVVDFRDEWIGSPLYDTRNPLRHLIERWLEKTVSKRAKRVLVISEQLGERLAKKCPGLDRQKIELLRNGFDPELFLKDDDQPRERESTFNFVYTGSLSTHRDPQFFFKAMERLLNERPELKSKIKVQFYGFIHQRHRDLMEKYRRLGWVDTYGSAAPAEIARVLKHKADACLIFFRRQEGGDASIAGKLYEYLAVRKPILCMDDPGGATTALLRSLSLPLNCTYANDDEIYRIIKEVIDNYPRYKEIYSLPEERLRQFNRKYQAERLAEIVFELAGDTGSQNGPGSSNKIWQL